MPDAVEMTIGKMHTSTTMSTFDSMPNPNHTTTIGAMATFGTAFNLDAVMQLEGPHVLAALDTEDVRLHQGGPCSLAGEWFVVELRYLG